MIYDEIPDTGGRYVMAVSENALCEVIYLPIDSEDTLPAGWSKDPVSMAPFIKQLKDYLDGRRKRFDLPLKPEGTDFQKKVWEALTKIPYGETRSYQDIAEAVGNRNASRAVGLACGRNPILIVIPCHRVIGKNGKLTGFSSGLELKQSLLDMEKGGNPF
jgi:O-6-methylguanine DNA methyltransferase